jgi:hypothetical protein
MTFASSMHHNFSSLSRIQNGRGLYILPKLALCKFMVLVFGRGAKLSCQQQHTYENENAMNVGANNHYVLLGLHVGFRLHNPISNT